ncbi:MAG: serine/threonine-protein kinase [Anaeromyxobacteraceae bacterium]
MSTELAPLDDRLALKGLLGEGGMGHVHRAFDRSLERAVAVKFLRGDDPRETERLVLEARLQARVEHENVVRVHAVGTLGGRPCLVLQLVEGRTLAELATGLPLATRVELVRQAALGLHAAHQQGLVHRDVKPGNVLVEEGPGAPVARLGDFGLAHGEEGGLTRSGFPAGTLEYMAPEQLAGTGPADFRADVYALGATLYAVLAGRPPFGAAGGLAPSPSGHLARGAGRSDPSSLLRGILSQDPPPLGAAAPPELALVAARAMEKEPAARYPSALALAEDLGRFQRGEPVLARPPSLGERAAKWARRNPAAARAVAVAVVAVLLGFGWAALAERRAGLDALEAARLGADAQRMESALRVAHLSPAHDLSPVYATIRAKVDELERTTGAAGAAARAFAVGRGLQLLRAAEPARAALEQAWSLGFRRPEAALALGLLDGERYARERQQLPRIDDARRKDAWIAELRARFREPAVARLRLAAASTAADRALLEARIALVEERHLEAATLARQAREAGADPLEASTLEGEAFLGRALELYEVRDLDGTLAPLAQAVTALRRAAEIGRSAPRPRLLLAQALMHEQTALQQREPVRKDRFDEALRVLDEGLALDASDPELLVARSEIVAEQGRIARQLGVDPGPFLVEAVRAADAATRAAPADRSAWERLAWACLNYARELRDARYEVDWAWEKGIAAATRAGELSPGSSVPPSLLSQMHTDRAETTEIRGGDARADIDAALVAARRVADIGDRPMVSKVLLGLALRQDATSRWSRGEDPDPRFSEAVRVMGEAWRYSEGQAAQAGHGVQIAVLWAEAALLEGRAPTAALTAVVPWAATLAARVDSDAIAAAQLAELATLQVQAKVLAGEDPAGDLARAVPLVERVVRSGVYPPMRGRLAELELHRAAWLAAHGGDPAPALAAARRHAELMKVADPSLPDGWRLEVEAVLATPAPGEAELARARAASEKMLALTPADPRLLALRGHVLLASGDREGARAALAKAEERGARLAWTRTLREKLR